jgi:hypothetical protein
MYNLSHRPEIHTMYVPHTIIEQYPFSFFNLSHRPEIHTMYVPHTIIEQYTFSLAQVVTILTCIQEMHGLNLSRVADCSDHGFFWGSCVPLDKCTYNTLN